MADERGRRCGVRKEGKSVTGSGVIMGRAVWLGFSRSEHTAIWKLFLSNMPCNLAIAPTGFMFAMTSPEGFCRFEFEPTFMMV